MTHRPQLHLVSDEGLPISPSIGESVKKAFCWTSRDFPNVDPALLSDWAESLAKSMHLSGGGIEDLDRYAYVALKGKVKDSLRKRSAQELTHGIGRDLERVGGSSASAQSEIERKILWDQLGKGLSERDRVIHFLIGRQESAQQIAVELNTSYPAARKAIQRLRERLDAIVRSPRKEKNRGQPIIAVTKEV